MAGGEDGVYVRSRLLLLPRFAYACAVVAGGRWKRAGKINRSITGDWYNSGNECNETGVSRAEMDKKCLSKMYRRTSHKRKKRNAG